MLHIPKIGDYLKILADDEVKNFLVIYFGEYFKSAREKFYSKLSEEQNLRKVAELLFLTTSDEVQKYVAMMHSSSFDNCICHYNIKIGLLKQL